MRSQSRGIDQPGRLRHDLPVPVGRDQLARAPIAYFDAVDRMALEETLAFFAPDATFTIQTAHVVFNGLDEIAGMFRGFFADHRSMRHGVRNLVVDETAQKASTEQLVPLVQADGTELTLTTCNFFDFAPDGRFSRVIVWMDGVNPLVGE